MLSGITLIPADLRTSKTQQQTFRHIFTSKDTYIYSFFPYTDTQWNNLPESCIQSQTVDTLREQLIPAVFYTLI